MDKELEDFAHDLCDATILDYDDAKKLIDAPLGKKECVGVFIGLRERKKKIGDLGRWVEFEEVMKLVQEERHKAYINFIIEERNKRRGLRT